MSGQYPPVFHVIDDGHTEKFSIIKKLGEGSYGSVYQAVHCETGTLIAVKQIPYQAAENREEKMREFTIVENANESQHLVHFFGTVETVDELWVSKLPVRGAH